MYVAPRYLPATALSSFHTAIYFGLAAILSGDCYYSSNNNTNKEAKAHS